MPEEQIEYKFDTQLLIEGSTATEDEINDYITEHFEGDCLIVVGDEELMKLHYHTNSPWKVLEYCASLGEIFDIVVENMQRQSEHLHGWKWGRGAPPQPLLCGRSALHPGSFCGVGSPSTHHAGAPPCTPEVFAGLAAPAPTMRALRPAPRPTFSRRESRQRYAKGCALWNPPVQGGRPFRARLRIAPGYLLPLPQTDLPLWLVGTSVFFSPQATPGVTPPSVNPWRGS